MISEHSLHWDGEKVTQAELAIVGCSLALLWCGVAWRGVAWCGVRWCGVALCGVV